MALRYLRGAQGREEGRGFLRFIIFAAVGGVAVGVAALLLALAIVRGFSSEIEGKIVGFGSHVQVQSGYQDLPIEQAMEIEPRLAGRDEVARTMQVVEDFALFRAGPQQIEGVAVVGTPELSPYLNERIVAGSGQYGPDADGRPGLVIGQELARRLGVEVGERVTLFSVRRPAGDPDLEAGVPRPRVRQFYVAGVFETSLGDFDDLYVFMDIGEARELLDFSPDAVTRFELTLHDINEAEAVARSIEEDLGFPYQALTIYQVFSGLFAWVNLQQTITPLIIAVIVIVAAFNIIGTLLMLMMEKTREIGILSSLGASGRSVRRLFLSLGLLIGVIGVSIGQLLALGLGLMQKHFEVIPLPAEAYYMTTAPVELNVLDFILVGSVALALCLVAAYIPAGVAARIQPVRAIRFQ